MGAYQESVKHQGEQGKAKKMAKKCVNRKSRRDAKKACKEGKEPEFNHKYRWGYVT